MVYSFTAHRSLCGLPERNVTSSEFFRHCKLFARKTLHFADSAASLHGKCLAIEAIDLINSDTTRCVKFVNVIAPYFH